MLEDNLPISYKANHNRTIDHKIITPCEFPSYLLKELENLCPQKELPINVYCNIFKAIKT